MSDLQESSIGHAPGDRWEFDADVTRVFDDMLERSIPQYEVMRDAVFAVSAQFVQPRSVIVDLGCSRGEALAKFVDRFGAGNYYVGVETSEPMVQAATARFRAYIDSAVCQIKHHDLRLGFPPMPPAAVVLSILTVQFIPIEYRQRIVQAAYDQLTNGGAFVMVEKVLGATAAIDLIMTSEYWKLKGVNGYSTDEIERKRMSLEGVLVPVTARWNEDLVASAGFRQIDCFWRWMNFAAWVAIR